MAPQLKQLAVLLRESLPPQSRATEHSYEAYPFNVTQVVVGGVVELNRVVGWLARAYGVGVRVW